MVGTDRILATGAFLLLGVGLYMVWMMSAQFTLLPGGPRLHAELDVRDVPGVMPKASAATAFLGGNRSSFWETIFRPENWQRERGLALQFGRGLIAEAVSTTTFTTATTVTAITTTTTFTTATTITSTTGTTATTVTTFTSTTATSTTMTTESRRARAATLRGGIPVAARGKPLVIFVTILAPAGGKPRRDKIRRTWLKQSRGTPGIEGRFFIGRGAAGEAIPEHLEAEIKEHGDIVVLDVPDTYAELARKCREMFAWAIINFKPAFVLKVDDDAYVNLEGMLLEAKGLPKELVYWGSMQVQPILRGGHRNAEFSMPREMSSFPPYASGGGYMLSADLAWYVGNPPVEPLPMTNEDAYLGVALLPFNVKRYNTPRVYAHGTNGCIATQNIGVIHYVKDDQNNLDCMDELHEIVTSNNGTMVCRSRYCGPMTCDYGKPAGWQKCLKKVDNATTEWAPISKSRACEGNSEGVTRFKYSEGIKGPLCCQQLCDETCGCVAVDFYQATLWCSLYRESCTSPSKSTDMASSWRRAPRKRRSGPRREKGRARTRSTTPPRPLPRVNSTG